MVTWRGTEDGFVTDAVREIYLRYALGGAGMIVLEATGIRDVASGPLLRLSHDRFVPGLRALRGRDAGGRRLAGGPADHRLPEDRHPQAHARVHGGHGRAAARLPESVLDLTDAEFEADHARHLPAPRSSATSSTATGRRSRTWTSPRSAASRAGSPPPPAARSDSASTAWSCTSPTPTPWPRSSPSPTARTDAYGGSFENRMRLPREVIAAVREEAGPDFLVGCRYLGSEDILGEDGRLHGNTLDDAQAIGVELARAGLDFLSVSRGGKFEDARQPPVGEAMYPYTGHSGARCIPRAQAAIPPA